MWVVVGVLLGLALLAALLGLHAGPHSHLLAGALGIAAAVVLVVMAIGGRAAPGLWVLFSADVVLSAGAVVAATKGLGLRHSLPWGHGTGGLEGAEGRALTDLDPDGLVRVHGESWSATSLNGPVRAGTGVQVIKAGVRLGVWGETIAPELRDSHEPELRDSHEPELHDSDEGVMDQTSNSGELTDSAEPQRTGTR